MRAARSHHTQVEPPQTHSAAGMSNVHVVVLRLPNSFRPLPLPLSLALLGERLPSPVGPCSISPTTHPHPRAPPSLLSLSPDHHAGTPEYFQSSGLPPTFREHPRGLFFALTPTALPSFQPNGESRLRLGVPIFPVGVPEAVSAVTRIHSVHAVEEGEPIRHLLSPWESRLVCAHWCHRDIHMTGMGSLLLAPT